MAYVYRKELVDDVDGETPATSELRFSVGNKRRVIHLCAANAAAFHEALDPWMRASSADRKTQAGKYAVTKRIERLRDYARAKGYDVPTRGRPAAWLIEAYEKDTGNTY